MGSGVDSPVLQSISPYPDLDPFEHERRFLLTRAQASDFVSAIGPRAEVELYDPARPLSFTRTTYLDDDQLSYFHSCAGEVAQRLRLREYALATTPHEVPLLSGTCFLELKQNAGTARWKIRIAAPARTLERIIDQGRQVDPRAAGVEQIAALAAIRDHLAPGPLTARLTTWYRRTCFAAEGGRVRITLDQDLTFCRPQRLGVAGEPAAPRQIVARGPARVLEIKYWGDEPEWLALATAGLAAAPRFSKFHTGMLALERKAA